MEADLGRQQPVRILAQRVANQTLAQLAAGVRILSTICAPWRALLLPRGLFTVPNGNVDDSRAKSGGKYSSLNPPKVLSSLSGRSQCSEGSLMHCGGVEPLQSDQGLSQKSRRLAEVACKYLYTN